MTDKFTNSLLLAIYGLRGEKTVLFSLLLLSVVFPNPSSAGRSNSGSRRSSISSWETTTRATKSDESYGNYYASGHSSSSARWGSSGSSSSRHAGTVYRVPVTSTYRRIAGGNNIAERPQATYVIPSARIPIRVVYSPAYINSFARITDGHGTPDFSPKNLDGFHGYYLGRMMGRNNRPHYSSYVPYREHYGSYYNHATTPAFLLSMEKASPVDKKVNPCILDRWNHELPMTELPNMALEFLVNDTISGSTIRAKRKFVFRLFKAATETFAKYNSSAEIFAVPSDAKCPFAWYSFSRAFTFMETFSPKNISQLESFPTLRSVEDPILIAVRNILFLYSRLSQDKTNLQDLVGAAKACLSSGDPTILPEVLPCLDFSLSLGDVLKLDNPSSIFQSEEICQKQLNPNLLTCSNNNDFAKSSCSMQHLLALNAFARNFYLCRKALEDGTFKELKIHEVEKDMVATEKAINADNFDTKYQGFIGSTYEQRQPKSDTPITRPSRGDISSNQEDLLFSSNVNYNYSYNYNSDEKGLSLSVVLYLEMAVGCFLSFGLIVACCKCCCTSTDREINTTAVENDPLTNCRIGIQDHHPTPVSGYAALDVPFTGRNQFQESSPSGIPATITSPLPEAELDDPPPSYDAVYPGGGAMKFPPRLQFTLNNFL